MRGSKRVVLGAVAVLAMAAGARYLMAQAGAAASATAGAAAPANVSDYFMSDKIRAVAEDLLAQAKAEPSGAANATLITYPGHFINVTARTKSGGSELHTHYNDIFIVLDGEANEVTGGTIPDMKMNPANGEGKGTTIVGGTDHILHKGDVLHISPSTPHMTIMQPGKTFTAIVVKVHQD